MGAQDEAIVHIWGCMGDPTLTPYKSTSSSRPFDVSICIDAVWSGEAIQAIPCGPYVRQVCPHVGFLNFNMALHRPIVHRIWVASPHSRVLLREASAMSSLDPRMLNSEDWVNSINFPGSWERAKVQYVCPYGCPRVSSTISKIS